MLSNKEVIKQAGFKFNWEPKQPESTILSDGFVSTRSWQAQAFELLKAAPYMILNAPMGSGKSWLMCLLSAYKMIKDEALRCIIAVPQTIIGPGFVEAKLQMPDGERLHWIAGHNLCDDELNTKTVNYALRWLEKPYNSFSDRILICTHATLVAVYKKLKTHGHLSLLHNLLVWIDEAHHVKNTSMEDLGGFPNSNSIGQLVGFLLNQTGNNIQLGLTTASFFRGDRHNLITEEMEAKFERFNLPYDQYLQSMEYLKSFSFDFLLCGHDYTKAIELLIKNRMGKDIIYVPHPTSRHSTGDKYREVENIIEKYQEVNGGELLDMDNGLTILRNANRDFKILDLVDEDRRDQKKNYINSPIIKHAREALDAIISLGMFKEGANWIWADRSIIVGARSSLVDIIQMIGRLFRDAKDKAHVEVIQLLPFSLDQQDDNKFKENLNNYLKAIYASLILEDILNPVRIKMPTADEIQVKDENVRIKKNDNFLAELVPDEAKRLSLIEEVSNKLMEIVHTQKDAGSVPVLWDEYQKVTPSILARYGVNHHIEEVKKQIWGNLARRTLEMRGISVENIDFDILQNTHPLEGLLRYTSGVCNIDTFEKLRRAIQSTPRLSEELILGWVKQHISLHGKKPGKHTGPIKFADGEYKDITWAAINQALKKGSRGLPGGSSLVKLINKELGIRSCHTPPPLSRQLVLDWVTKFIEKHGRKPTQSDEAIEFAQDEYKGETWGGINSALWKGRRGFPGGSSLASFIQEELNIKNHLNLSPLTVAQIIDWANQYIETHGKKPTRKSGVVEFADGVHDGITWENVNASLEIGLRGLPGGSSLPKLLHKKLGIANPMDLPLLTMEIVVEWVSYFIKTHKKKPHRNSGKLEFVPRDYKGISWNAIDTALKKGRRGLLGGFSLAELIQQNFGLRSHKNTPPLTDELIIEWVTLYFNKYGKKPNMGSGAIEFATGPYAGITWLAINTALFGGGRGFLGGSSLSQFIEQKLGLFNRVSQEKLPEELILQWVNKYIELHGRKPYQKSGTIEFAESPFKGITWSMIDCLLRIGGRGLLGGSSLAQFIERRLGLRSRKKTLLTPTSSNN